MYSCTKLASAMVLLKLTMVLGVCAALVPLRPAAARWPRARVARLASAGDDAPAEAAEAVEAVEAVEEVAEAAVVEPAAPPPAPRVVNAKKDYEDFNPDQPDIVQKFVKQRDDWWSSSSPFPGAPVDDKAAGPVGALAALPLPAYLWLTTSVVLCIAFTGSCFQLFYNVPRAPVLGVPLTSLILATSGPAFVFLFLTAIARGQREADEDDAKNGF